MMFPLVLTSLEQYLKPHFNAGTPRCVKYPVSVRRRCGFSKVLSRLFSVGKWLPFPPLYTLTVEEAFKYNQQLLSLRGLSWLGQQMGCSC